MLKVENLNVSIQSVQILREVSLALPTGTMAGLIVMMFIVVAMNSLLAVAERRLLRWQPASRYGVAPNQ